jgi:hypothetical protein
LSPEASPEDDIDPAAAPPASKPLWRRLPLQWLVFAVIVAGGGIGGAIANADRSSSGEIVKGGDLTAVDLRVGDCFDLKDPAAVEIDDVTAGPCTDEHEYEMFFAGAMPEGSFPPDAAIDEFTGDKCTGAFDAYVGKSYEDSELEIFVLTPTEAAWLDGDRIVQCAVYHPRIHSLTASLKGSAQ